jgi:hypothetical protein
VHSTPPRSRVNQLHPMPLRHPTAWLAVTLLCLLAPTLRAESYADWLNANFIGDAASPNPLIDPDRDGLSNLAEYAFGLNPKSPSADTPPLSAPTAPAATGEITFELLERAGPRGGRRLPRSPESSRAGPRGVRRFPRGGLSGGAGPFCERDRGGQRGAAASGTAPAGRARPLALLSPVLLRARAGTSAGPVRPVVRRGRCA